MASGLKPKALDEAVKMKMPLLAGKRQNMCVALGIAESDPPPAIATSRGCRVPRSKRLKRAFL